MGKKRKLRSDYRESKKLFTKTRRLEQQNETNEIPIDIAEDIANEATSSKVSKQNNFLKGLKKNESEIMDLMKNTIKQQESMLWIQERKKRITASFFGKICQINSTTDSINMVKQMLQSFSSASSKVLSIAYGIENEPIALKEFSVIIKKKIEPCGLFVDKNDCYLGATPDGLLGEDEIVEITCPYSCKDLKPSEAAKSKKFYMELISEQYQLKRTHIYYFQVQGQLHVTDRKFFYFVVWTPKGLIYEKIARDTNFFNEKMKDKLKTFYFDYYLPELLKLEHA